MREIPAEGTDQYVCMPYPPETMRAWGKHVVQSAAWIKLQAVESKMPSGWETGKIHGKRAWRGGVESELVELWVRNRRLGTMMVHTIASTMRRSLGGRTNSVHGYLSNQPGRAAEETFGGKVKHTRGCCLIGTGVLLHSVEIIIIIDLKDCFSQSRQVVGKREFVG